MDKKYWSLVGLVLVLGGLGFALSQSNFLKGSLDLPGGNLPLNPNPDLVLSIHGELSAQEAAGGAERAANQALTYANQASAALERAQNAFTDGEQSLLVDAQVEAEEAAQNAESEAQSAQSYADRAEAAHQEAQAAYDSIYEHEIGLREELADTYEAWQSAIITHSVALNAYIMCQTQSFSTDCSEKEAEKNTAETNMNQLETLYNDYYDQVQDAHSESVSYRDDRDQAESYAEDAQEYADLASTYALEARDSASAANEYTILACQNLRSSAELQGNSYEVSIWVDIEDGRGLPLLQNSNLDLSPLPSLNPSLLETFSLATFGDESDNFPQITTRVWNGSIVLESDNPTGLFTSESGESGNPLSLSFIESSETELEILVRYTPADSNDTLSIYSLNEQNNCSSQLLLDPEDTTEVNDETPEETEENGPTNEKEIDDIIDEIIAAPNCTHYFTDLDGHWSEDMVCRMAQAGVLIGYEDGTFRPNQNITRAEAIKIIDLIAGFDVRDSNGKTENFPDVNSGDWYLPYFIIAQDQNVVRPIEGPAHPNVAITRGDVVLWWIRMADQQIWGWNANDIPFNDLTIYDYFTYAFIIAHDTVINVPNQGLTPLVEGYPDGSSGAWNNLTRAEAVALALRMRVAFFAK